jgi:hypothetical protein
MKQSHSWEANQFSASQEIPRILWKLKVHYHIHMCPPPISILSLLDPVLPHIPLPDDSSSYSPIYAWASQVVLSLRFPHLNPVYAPPTPHTFYMPCPTRSSQFNHLNNIGWGAWIIKLLLHSLLHSPVTSSLLGPNILLNTLFSDTFSLVPSSVWVTKFHIHSKQYTKL